MFVLQTGAGHKMVDRDDSMDTTLNDSCMELCIIASGCRRASAKRVVAVLPYYPYSKQSKQKRRGTIAARLFADLLKAAGLFPFLALITYTHTHEHTHTQNRQEEGKGCQSAFFFSFFLVPHNMLDPPAKTNCHVLQACSML